MPGSSRRSVAPAAFSTAARWLAILAAVAPTDENAREVEESRESYREWLSGPESFLAAVSRYELPIGHSVRFGAKGDVELAEAGAEVTVAATDDGFRVD